MKLILQPQKIGLEFLIKFGEVFCSLIIMMVVTVAFLSIVVMVMMLVLMVMTAATLIFIIVIMMVMIVFMLMVMVVVMSTATLFIMIMVMMLVIVAMTLLIVVVVMVVFMLMVMTAAALAVMVMMVMIMVMTVAFDMLIDLVEESTVIHCMVHPVLELMFIDIENSAHECEIDLLLGIEVSVLFNPVAHISEIVCDTSTVIERNCSFDVSEHRASFFLYPFTNLEHCSCESCFSIGVPASNPTRNSCCTAVGLFK